MKLNIDKKLDSINSDIEKCKEKLKSLNEQKADLLKKKQEKDYNEFIEFLNENNITLEQLKEKLKEDK